MDRRVTNATASGSGNGGATVEINMQSTPVVGSKRDLVSILHGDAREVLKEFPDETFDCLITDPPYSVGITNNEKGRPRWDRSRIAFDPEFWALVYSKMRPGATALIFSAPRNFPRTAVAAEDGGFTIIDTLCWIHGQGYAAGFRHLDAELGRVGAPELAGDFAGWGNMIRPAFEPILLARRIGPRESLATVIAEGGVGGLNVDACRLPAGHEDRSRTPGQVSESATWRVDRPALDKSTPPPAGRMPSNVLLQHAPSCTASLCIDTCPVAQVHQQGLATRGRNEDATRFYQSFLHHPKATRGERPEVDGISGPTVKPLGVMDWLVKLSTRPGQLVLDPFAGTGTTLEACALAGVRAVGIEKEAAYLPLIEKRLQGLL